MFYLKGLHRIRISCKLQEAAAKYASEGWGHIYFSLAGTDCQIFLTLLTKLFGEPDLLEATVAEEQEAVASGERNPLETIYVYTPKYPVPVNLGVEKDFLPVNSQREEPKKKGDIVTKSYYTCVICNHSSQNRASTINHTRWEMNIKLACHLCNYAVDASDSLTKHIRKIHHGQFVPGGLTEQEAQDVPSTLAAESAQKMFSQE